MLTMFLYVIGIMYSPGPINLMGVNVGINNKIKESIGFYTGVALSMCMYSIIFGFAGEKVVRKEYLIYLSLLGSGYIMYIAMKIWNSSISLDNRSDVTSLKFQNGFITQSLNPKAMLAILPLVTIHFPSNNIRGVKIIFASIIVGILSFFAPLLYSLTGKFLGKFIKEKAFFLIINRVMVGFLVFIVIIILRDHVYLVLRGINP